MVNAFNYYTQWEKKKRFEFILPDLLKPFFFCFLCCALHTKILVCQIHRSRLKKIILEQIPPGFLSLRASVTVWQGRSFKPPPPPSQRNILDFRGFMGPVSFAVCSVELLRLLLRVSPSRHGKRDTWDRSKSHFLVVAIYLIAMTCQCLCQMPRAERTSECLSCVSACVCKAKEC